MTIDPSSRPPPFFVGDHPAMDFLNTAATPSGTRIEWLRNGADLVDWLERSGVIDAAAATRFRTQGDVGALDAVAERARALREWLRGFVQAHAGAELTADDLPELAPLNRLLAEEDSFMQVEAAAPDGHRLRRRRAQRWAKPEQLLQPIAEAIADLVCEADFRLIRACEGADCTLTFLDRTKAHARRWCSMAACGNRAKVAAHRARASAKGA
jgi:predicted RNA-binding Zn ribbon-like protein